MNRFLRSTVCVVALLCAVGVRAAQAEKQEQVASVAQPARIPVSRPDRPEDPQPQTLEQGPVAPLPRGNGSDRIGVLSDEAVGVRRATGERRRKLYVVEDETSFVAEICQQIEEVSNANDLPPGFMAKLIWKESWFDPNAISPKGAEGIAQFMPGTAKIWGLENSFDPMEAISASGAFLGHLYRGYGNLGLAAAGYNAGERRVDAWRAGRSGLPRETRNYVFSITGYKADEWKKGDGPQASFALDESRPFQIACNEMPVHKAPLQRYFANTYYNRALRLARKGEYEDAIVRYSVAIRLKADFPLAYNNRGIVYRKIGDFESAIANYDTAIKMKPDYAAAHNNRGYAYRKLGRFEEAVADYDTAIKLKPGYAAALFNRGFAKAQLGLHEDAVADYSAALKLQPKNALAHYNRALSYIELGKTEAARKDFDKAIAANSGYAKAYYRRAMLLRELGKSKLAHQDYQKSVSLDERFGHARYKKLFE